MTTRRVPGGALLSTAAARLRRAWAAGEPDARTLLDGLAGIVQPGRVDDQDLLVAAIAGPIAPDPFNPVLLDPAGAG